MPLHATKRRSGAVVLIGEGATFPFNPIEELREPVARLHALFQFRDGKVRPIEPPFIQYAWEP
jgi:hypothetical protein